MNKFEFQEQIIDVQALIEEGRYQEAAEMADKLNLELLEEPRTLRQLARAYEKCGRYADAEILLMKAYDYAPRSRGILFSLCNTAIRAGNLEGAEGFYDDFCHLAPRDSQRYVIQYRLSVAKNRPDPEIIEILETLRADEPNDRWLYILAQYYAKNGRINDAVKVLDEIDLWFDSGKYVERAAELKAYLTGTVVPEKKPASVSYTYTFTEEEENQDGESKEAASETAEKAADVTETETDTEADEKADPEVVAESDTESDPENVGETETETGTESAEDTETPAENVTEAAEEIKIETAGETVAKTDTETAEDSGTETETGPAEEKDTEADTEIAEEIAPEIGTAFVAESVAETLKEIETSAGEAAKEDQETLSETGAEGSDDDAEDIQFESVYSVSKGEQLFETDESWIEDLTRGLYTVDPPRSEKPAVKEKPEDTSDAAAGQEEEGPLSDEEVLVQLLDEVPEKKEPAEEAKELLTEEEPEETSTAAEETSAADETSSEDEAVSEEEAEAEEDDRGFNGLLNRIARRKEEKDLFGGLPVDPDVNKRIWHFIILAENTELAEACARDLVKEIGEQNPGISLPKAKLKAAKIGNVSIIGALDHFLGRMTIVENASVLSDSQLDEFTKILDRDDRSLLIGFTDTRENIVKLFERMPGLAECFTAVFDGRERTPDDLLNIVQSYFYEADARLSADAEAVVLKKAADLLAASRTSARREILHFAEQGLDKAEKGGFLGFGAGKVDSEGVLTVAAKHFKGLE